MQPLPFQMERTVVIRARQETVFRFFTDSARWANWWGTGSTIDARPGGKVYIRHANGVESLGEVLEVRVPDLIVFTYGFANGKPIPPGASRVTIHLAPHKAGTQLHLRHEFAEAEARDEHVQGWRFQLSLFSNTVANEVFSNVAATVDRWFEAWVTADSNAREEELNQIAAPNITFRDRFSLLDGLADLTAHIGAAQRFMPGIRLQRKHNTNIRQCQGTVLADWSAIDGSGQERMTGTSVFCFQADGLIESVTSLAAT